MFETQYLSISISSKVEEVYNFISNPQNLPSWASGLSGSIQQVNGEWIAKDLKKLKTILEK